MTTSMLAKTHNIYHNVKTAEVLILLSLLEVSLLCMKCLIIESFIIYRFRGSQLGLFHEAISVLKQDLPIKKHPI